MPIQISRFSIFLLPYCTIYPLKPLPLVHCFFSTSFHLDSVAIFLPPILYTIHSLSCFCFFFFFVSNFSLLPLFSSLYISQVRFPFSTSGVKSDTTFLLPLSTLVFLFYTSTLTTSIFHLHLQYHLPSPIPPSPSLLAADVSTFMLLSPPFISVSSSCGLRPCSLSLFRKKNSTFHSLHSPSLTYISHHKPSTSSTLFPPLCFCHESLSAFHWEITFSCYSSIFLTFLPPLASCIFFFIIFPVSSSHC